METQHIILGLVAECSFKHWNFFFFKVMDKNAALAFTDTSSELDFPGARGILSQESQEQREKST